MYIICIHANSTTLILPFFSVHKLNFTRKKSWSTNRTVLPNLQDNMVCLFWTFLIMNVDFYFSMQNISNRKCKCVESNFAVSNYIYKYCVWSECICPPCTLLLLHGLMTECTGFRPVLIFLEFQSWKCVICYCILFWSC